MGTSVISMKPIKIKKITLEFVSKGVYWQSYPLELQIAS
jgi:hypothetical protein